MSEYVKRAELHTELADFATKTDLKVEIEKLKTTMIQWFVGSSISIAALVIAAVKFLH